MRLLCLLLLVSFLSGCANSLIQPHCDTPPILDMAPIWCS